MAVNFAVFLVAVVVLYWIWVYGYPRLRRLMRGKGVVYIAPKDLEKQMSEKKDMLMIDIRYPSEFYNMFGHIDGAVNIPFAKFMGRINETADRLAGFKSIPVVLIGLRDEQILFKAYKALRQKGFNDVSILDNGLSAWLRQGLPTVERNVRKD